MPTESSVNRNFLLNDAQLTPTTTTLTSAAVAAIISASGFTSQSTQQASVLTIASTTGPTSPHQQFPPTSSSSPPPFLLPPPPSSSLTTAPTVGDGNVLKKVVSFTVERTNFDNTTSKVSRPSYVPEKLNFGAYEKFEGELNLYYIHTHTHIIYL